MADLGQQYPELSDDGPSAGLSLIKMPQLNDALAKSLAARRPAEIATAFQACRLVFEQDLGTVDSNWPQGSEGLEPDSVVSELFAQRPHLVPLAALVSLLEITAPMKEATWGGQRDSLLYRPVLVRLVGRIVKAIAGAEAPPLCHLGLGLTVGDPPALPRIPPALAGIYAPGCSREVLAELEGLFEKLAGHDLALRLTRREISLFDRIVFWSDTPAEARERELVSDRTALCEEIATRWLDLERTLRGKRGGVWSVHAIDSVLAVRDAIGGIVTPAGESTSPKDCPLLYQELAIWQTQAFANEVKQRFGLAWSRVDLVDRALSHGSDSTLPPKPDEGFLDSSWAPDLLGPVLVRQGFPERLRDLRKARAESEQAKDALRTAKSQISTWERPNVFKDSPAEAREQAMVSALSRGAERLEEMETSLRQELESALARVHQPSLVGLLLAELVEAVDALRAECASSTRTFADGDDNTRYATVYFCVLRGMAEAQELLARLMAAVDAESVTYLPLWEAAEIWAIEDLQVFGP